MKFDIIKDKMGGTLQLLQGNWTQYYMGELYVKILNALFSFFFSVFKMRGTTVKLKKNGSTK